VYSVPSGGKCLPTLLLVMVYNRLLNSLGLLSVGFMGEPMKYSILYCLSMIYVSNTTKNLRYALKLYFVF